jgi:hypothetical protein
MLAMLKTQTSVCVSAVCRDKMHSKDVAYLKQLMPLLTACVCSRMVYDVISSSSPALLTPLS